MQTLALSPIAQVAPTAAKGQSQGKAVEESGSFEDALIAQDELVAVEEFAVLPEEVEGSLSNATKGDVDQPDAPDVDVPAADIKPAVDIKPATDAENWLPNTEDFPEVSTGAPDVPTDDAPAEPLVISPAQPKDQRETPTPRREAPEMQGFEKVERPKRQEPVETVEIAKNAPMSMATPAPAHTPDPAQPVAAPLQSATPQPSEWVALAIAKQTSLPQRLASEPRIPQATPPQTAQVPQFAQAAAVMPQQPFQLQPVARETNAPRFELTWPAKGAAPDATPIQPATKVQIRPATPIQTHLESLLSKESKTLMGAASDLIGDLDAVSTVEPGRTRAETVATPQNFMALVQTRAELPPNVARQIAEVMQRAPDRAVELSLSPAELGSVRMKLSPADHGMVVSVFAERPETLDLLRRNIDALERAITDLGYEGVEFAFDTNAGDAEMSDGSGNDADSSASPNIEQPAAPQPTAQEQRAPRRLGGLDVRV